MIQPGIYGEGNILGSKVRIISSPGYELFGEYENDKIYTIKKIENRVTLDGKFNVRVILDGLENHSYSPKDLEIVELNPCKTNDGGGGDYSEAEAERVLNEGIRQENEEKRQSAEKSRQEAEEKREKIISEIKVKDVIVNGVSAADSDGIVNIDLNKNSPQQIFFVYDFNSISSDIFNGGYTGEFGELSDLGIKVGDYAFTKNEGLYSCLDPTGNTAWEEQDLNNPKFKNALFLITYLIDSSNPTPVFKLYIFEKKKGEVGIEIKEISSINKSIESYIKEEISKNQGEVIEINVINDNNTEEDDLNNPKISSFDFDVIKDKFDNGIPIVILYKYSIKDNTSSGKRQMIDVLNVYNINKYSYVFGSPRETYCVYTISTSNETKKIVLTRTISSSSDTDWRLEVTNKISTTKNLMFDYIN